MQLWWGRAWQEAKNGELDFELVDCDGETTPLWLSSDAWLIGLVVDSRDVLFVNRDSTIHYPLSTIHYPLPHCP